MNSSTFLAFCFVSAIFLTFIILSECKKDLNLEKGRIFSSMMASGAGSQNLTGIDAATQFLASLPILKLGVLSSVSQFFAPILQGFLITVMIIFTLTGTANLLCQMIDCPAAIANFNSASYAHPHSNNGYHTGPQFMSGNYPRRKHEQRKTWSSVIPEKIMDQVIEKYGD